MTAFLAALAAFLLFHVIPPMPPVRRRLVARLGLRAYLVAYSALSILLLIWLIASAVAAPMVLLWPTERWQAFVPLVLMPFALWFAVGGLAEANPLSISFRPAGDKAGPGPMASVTRHPLLWAFLLWSVAHIPPNGDVVSLIMFGGLAGLAAGGFALLDLRARRRMGADIWRQRTAATSIIPFAAILAGRIRPPTWRPLLIYAVVAAALCGWILLQGHVLVIGSDPLLWLR